MTQELILLEHAACYLTRADYLDEWKNVQILINELLLSDDEEVREAASRFAGRSMCEIICNNLIGDRNWASPILIFPDLVLNAIMPAIAIAALKEDTGGIVRQLAVRFNVESQQRYESELSTDISEGARIILTDVLKIMIDQSRFDQVEIATVNALVSMLE